MGSSHPLHPYDPFVSRYKFNEPRFTWQNIHTGTWCHLTSWEISVQQQPHVSHARCAHSTRRSLLHWCHPYRQPPPCIRQLLKVWKEILVKHKRKFCTVSCLSAHLDFGWRPIISNWFTDFKTSFLPKRPAVKHLLNCGDLRDWVKNAAVVPAQAENSGWPFMSFASWSLTSSGIFRLPELLFSKHQKEDIMKNSDFNFIQHNHSFVLFFFCPEQNQHFKSPPVIHKHPPQCQLNYREETEKKILIRVFTCNRMFFKLVWTVNYRG